MTSEPNKYTVMMEVEDPMVGTVTSIALRKDRTPALMANHYSDEYFEQVAEEEIWLDDTDSPDVMSGEEMDEFRRDILLKSETLMADQDWRIWVWEGHVDIRDPEFDKADCALYIGQMKDGKYNTVKDRYAA